VTAEVTVRNDPTHGTLAGVRVAGLSHQDAVKRCAELLGSFQIRHAVESG
jgi:fatty-acyl-CoA synthase